MSHAATQTTETAPPTPSTPAPRLFVHSKREQWGLAILLWERDGKRGYRFEDGSERSFKDGYYHLFMPRTPGELTERQQALLHSAATSERSPLSLRRQLELFERKFPGGFSGETWANHQRERKNKKALKRHRVPVLREAAAVLSKGELASLAVSGDHESVLGRVVEVLRSTDLVTSRTVQILEQAAAGPAFTQALTTYLHGTTETEAAAFEGWLTALRRAGVQPNWALATVLRALVHPDRHTVIKPTVLRSQFDVLGTSVYPTKAPSAASYTHCRNTLETLRSRVQELGQTPTDLIDLYDFVWTTLRPAALKEYTVMDVERTAADNAA